MRYLFVLIVLSVGSMPNPAYASDAERAAALFFGLEQDAAASAAKDAQSEPPRNIRLHPEVTKPFRRLPVITEAEKAELQAFKERLKAERNRQDATVLPTRSRQLYNSLTEDQKATLRQIQQERERRRNKANR